MSKEIDQRIVEMQFNNSDFERNAKDTISTIDRLKSALNFRNSSSALDQLGSATEAVSVKMDFMSTLAVNAFNRISNAILDATQKITKFGTSLTIDQIGAGFDKYTSKTEAVQTIMSATAQNFSDTGKQMEYVNEQLTKLNWFTDETSYAFTDMVNNIGKFTSNNIDLETSVTAMQGIATWAAKSGAGVNGASRAMYNLSQAVGMGYLSVADWKSIEIANMATYEFKQAAIEAAAELGKLEKTGENTFKTIEEGEVVTAENLRSTLQFKWLDNDVLTTVLEKYGKFTDFLYNTVEATDFEAAEILENIEKYYNNTLDINKLARDTGISVKDLTSWFEQMNDETMKFGYTAFKAAQEAKTFEEAINYVKDAASTGWLNIFEHIFGDYEHARKLWTDLANELGAIFVEPVAFLDKATNLWSTAFNGREKLIEGWYNTYGAIKNIAGSIKDALLEAFNLDGSTDDLAQYLNNITTRFNKWSKNLAFSYDEENKAYQSVLETLRKGDELTKGRYGTDQLANWLSLYQKGQLDINKLYQEERKNLGEIGISLQDLKNWYGQVTNSQVDYSKNLRSTIVAATDLFDDTVPKMVTAADKFTHGIFGEEQITKWVEEHRQGTLSVTKLYQDHQKELDKLGISFSDLNNWYRQITQHDSSSPLWDMVDQYKEGSLDLLQVYEDNREQLDALGISLADLNNWYETVANSQETFAEGLAQYEKIKAVEAAKETLKEFAKEIFNVGNAFKNLFGASVTKALELFVDIAKIAKEQWSEVFDGKLDTSGIVDAIDSITEKIREFTLSDEALEHIASIFRGLFSVIDIGRQILSGAAQALMPIISGIASLFGLKVNSSVNGYLSFFGGLGDQITKFATWAKDTEFFTDALKGLAGIITDVGDAIDGFIKGFTGSDVEGHIDGVITSIRNLDPKQVAEDFENLLGGIGAWARAIWEELGEGAQKVADFLLTLKDKKPGEIFAAVIQKIRDKLEELRTKITTFFKDHSIGDALDVLRNKISKFAKDHELPDFLTKIVDKFKELKDKLGLNALTGVFGGDESKLSGFKDKIIGFFTPLIDKLKEFAASVTPAKIAIFSLVTGVIFMIFSIASAAKKLGGVGGSISKFFNALSTHFKNKDKEKLGDRILKIAAALAILVGALYVLGKMDKDALIQGGIALAAIAGGLVLLMGGMALLAKVGGDGSAFKNAGMAILMTAAGLLVLVIALKQLNDLQPSKNLVPNLIMVGIVFVVLVGLAKLLSGSGATSIASGLSGAISLLLLVFALNSLVKTLTKLSKIDSRKIYLGVVNLIPVVIMLGVLALIARATGKDGGSAIRSLALSVFALSISIAILGALDPAIVERGVAVVTKMLWLFSGILILMSLGNRGGTSAKGASALILMALAILLLIPSIYLLGSMDRSVLIQGELAVAALLVIMGIILNLAKEAKGAAAAIALTTVLMVALVAGLMILADVPMKKLKNATIALGSVLLALTAAMFVLSKSKMDRSIWRTVGIMTVVLAEVVAALLILNKFATSSGLLEKAEALSLVLVALAGAMWILGKSKITSAKMKNVGKMMLQMAEVIALATAALWVLDNFTGGEGMIEKATALSEVMAALSLAMIGISIASMLAVNPTGMSNVILGMIAVIGLSAIALAALDSMTVSDGLIAKATALSAVMIALSLAMIGISFASLLAVNPAGMMTVVLGMILFVAGALTLASLVGSFADNTAIDKGLDIMVNLFSKLGEMVGNFIGGVLGGIAFGFLRTLADDFSYFADAMSNIPDGVLDGVAALTGTLLAITGADFVAALLNNPIADIILGDSGIEKALQGLIELIPTIKELQDSSADLEPDRIVSVCDAVSTLVGTLHSITGERSGGIVGAVETAVFGSTTDIEEFAQQCKTFIGAAVDIDNALKEHGSINQSRLEKAVSIGETLSAFAKSLPDSASLAGAVSGGNSVTLDTFADECKAFVGAACDIDGMLKEYGSISKSRVETVKTVGEMLAGLANALPESNSFIGILAGHNMTLDTFATQCKAFVSAACDIDSMLKENGTISKSRVNSAVTAGEMLAGLAEALPDDSGVFSSLFSGNLETFGNQAEAFISAACTIDNMLKESGTISKSRVESAVNAGEMLVGLAEALQGSSANDIGAIDKIVDAFTKESLDTFGADIEAFATHLANFDSTFASVDVTRLGSLSDITKTLVDSLAVLDGADISNSSFKGLQNPMDRVGSAIVNFANLFENVSATSFDKVADAADSIIAFTDIGSAVSSEQIGIVEDVITSIVDLTEKVEGYDSSALSSFSAALDSVGTIDLSGFVSGLTSGDVDLAAAGLSLVSSVLDATTDHATEFFTCGADLVGQFIDGLLSKNETLTESGTTIASTVTTAIQTGISNANFDLSNLNFGTSNAAEEGAADGSSYATGFNIGGAGGLDISSLFSTVDFQSFGFDGFDDFISAFINGDTAGIDLDSMFSGFDFQSLGFDGAESFLSAFTTGGISDIDLASMLPDASGFATYGGEAGEFYGTGLSSGLDSTVAEVEGSASELANSVIKSANGQMQVASPSRVAMTSGEYFGQGLAIGITSQSDLVSNAAASLGEAAVTALNTALGSLGDMLSPVGTLDLSGFITGLTSGGAELAGAGAAMASTVLSAINATPGEFQAAGTAQVSNVAAGVTGSTGTLAAPGAGLATALTNAIRSKYSVAVSAGAYLVTGIINGVRNRSSALYATIRSVAANTVATMYAAMGENSPSRYGVEAGEYLDIGLINGINNMADKVSDASGSMATQTVTALQKSLAGVSDMTDQYMSESARVMASPLQQMLDGLGGDLSVSPVITPVLDMTEIQNGRRTLDSLFSNRIFSSPTFGSVDLFADNSGAVTSGYNDAMVVQAIQSLKSDINQLGTTIGQMQVVMDSGKLVGSIGSKVDQSLGQMQRLRNRGL